MGHMAIKKHLATEGTRAMHAIEGLVARLL